MPKKKEETTMLVRAVPIDVSERVRRYCKREGIKYREFLERAIDLFEGSNQEQGPEQQEQVNPIQVVEEISKKTKAYKAAIRLKKDLEFIVKDVSYLSDVDTQRNVCVEAGKMADKLNKIFDEYVPKHELPDDPFVRMEMGIPSDLAFDAREVEVPKKDPMYDFIAGQFAEAEKKLKEDIEKLHQEMSAAGEAPKGNDEPAQPQEEESVVAGPNPNGAPSEPIQESAKEEPTSQEEKKEIKTTRFGRGFDGWVKE